MAQPSCAPSADRITIVGPQYCLPNPIDIFITRKLTKTKGGKFAVSDEIGNIIFKVKRVLSKSLHNTHLVIDGFGNSLLTIRRKIRTVHRRYEVYKEDSSHKKDLLFSVRRSSLHVIKTKMDVFLPSNTTEDVPDFKIQGGWLERSCSIYLGESPTIVAQMHKKHNIQKNQHGNEAFSMTVYQNTDYAFIVALIVIRSEISDTD